MRSAGRSRSVAHTLSFIRTARRAIRAVRLLAGERRIPRGLRWLAAIGLLPVPGPVDEALLLLVAVIAAVFYRDLMREAWNVAGS